MLLDAATTLIERLYVVCEDGSGSSHRVALTNHRFLMYGLLINYVGS